jgi:hypothetical protein
MKRYLAALSLVLALSFVLALPACGDDDESGGPEPGATTAGVEEATPAADVSEGSVIEAVTGALEQKHDAEPGTFEVTLETIEDGRYAKGSVRDEGSGAIWFAALVDGEWRIVWDGNGNVDCAELEPYADFPASLLPICVNFSDGSTEQR